MLALGCLGVATAFAAWQGGISRIGVASGVVFFDESLGASKLLGGAVVFLGVYLPGANEVTG